ncbi:MAG: hypothetical protein EOP47_21335, partial [Sphingobacteriaceae bacterium]
ATSFSEAEWLLPAVGLNTLRSNNLLPTTDSPVKAKDIYEALGRAHEQLAKYTIIKLIFPDQAYFPVEIVNGFQKFCIENNFKNEVVSCIGTASINKGDVFINLMEDDLVTLLERTMAHEYVVGKDVGIISYNETPMKKLILNGITTISTDFRYMGAAAANMILKKSKCHIEVPFYYTSRASL